MGKIDRPPLHLSASSVKEGLRVLSRNPFALGDYVFEGLDFSVERQCFSLIRSLNHDDSEISEYFSSIKYNITLNRHIRNQLDGVHYGEMYAPGLLYVLVRKFKPNTVIETGVSAGISSAYILQALEDNKNGHLYSIDYPNYTVSEGLTLPKGKSTGFVIPDGLRKRWTLYIGKSKDLMSPVLRKIGEIDMFVHDSEHSYQNMFFEYCQVWNSLRNGGLLVSHDINDNKAFSDFAKAKNKKAYEIYFSGIGVIKK